MGHRVPPDNDPLAIDRSKPWLDHLRAGIECALDQARTRFLIAQSAILGARARTRATAERALQLHDAINRGRTGGPGTPSLGRPVSGLRKPTRMRYFEFPPGCKARGRNGNFEPATARTSFTDDTQGTVSIYSRSEGPTAPIWIMGNRLELAQLFRQLAEALEQRTPIG